MPTNPMPKTRSKKKTARAKAKGARNSEPQPTKKENTKSEYPEVPTKFLSAHLADTIDRASNAYLGRVTGGFSPEGLALAYYDWLVHLCMAPGRRARLVEKALRKAIRLNLYINRCMAGGAEEPCIEPLPGDRRFRYSGWQQWPFNLFYQAFLLNQQWWHNATTGIPGVSKQHEAMMHFAARQLLDMYSPSNFVLTNPEVLDTTLKEGGQNLIRGLENYIEDWGRIIRKERPVGTEAYRVGENVAITPGKVVFRNHLFELIQYSPSTKKVFAEPILMLSAWIMKYYILDLSAHNSMAKYLVDQGHTVFIISWRNPTAKDRDISFDDYRRHGVMAALDAIATIVPRRQVHLVGYCLGGILSTIAAATMARDRDQRLKTLTLFTTQTDFTEPGEMMLFINQSQLMLLEDMMWDQGYLDSHQMAGAFQILRSNDLIWSRLVRDYLLGQRQSISDLMAWNSDATRLPYRMHAEFLNRCFLNNELATGHYTVESRTIAVSDIRAPIFCVAAERDHVAPWKSVYKIRLLADADEVTFLLTSGGHNVGIISEPGHPLRHYRVSTSRAYDQYVDPDTWYTQTSAEDGSWWPVWHQWLVDRSDNHEKPPQMGAPDQGYVPICDAPGTYVMQS